MRNTEPRSCSLVGLLVKLLLRRGKDCWKVHLPHVRSLSLLSYTNLVSVCLDLGLWFLSVSFFAATFIPSSYARIYVLYTTLPLGWDSPFTVAGFDCFRYWYLVNSIICVFILDYFYDAIVSVKARNWSTIVHECWIQGKEMSTFPMGSGQGVETFLFINSSICSCVRPFRRWRR